jgi:hypothetical protein
MCLPILGAVVGLAGAAVSGIGAKQQADAQAEKEEYEAKVAKINARSQRQISYSKQEDLGAKYDKQRGQSIALASKGGVDPSFGSAALVIFGENAFAESVDKGRQYVEGESQAVGEENRARGLEASAANHRQAGKIAMASSFLSGLGGVAKGLGGGGGGGSSLMINS